MLVSVALPKPYVVESCRLNMRVMKGRATLSDGCDPMASTILFMRKAATTKFNIHIHPMQVQLSKHRRCEVVKFTDATAGQATGSFCAEEVVSSRMR